MKEQNLFKCTITVEGRVRFVYIICKDMHECYNTLKEKYNIVPTTLQQLNVEEDILLIKE